MARMIPQHGPHETNSHGERTLYKALESGLPDDYTVIHSLPWLCSAVKKIDPDDAPTGEIDFLIVHPVNGVLALEVKSGKYRVENSVFVHERKNFTIDPVGQMRRNLHGLSYWIGVKPSLRLRIGYGYIFPDSDFQAIPTSSGMYDTTSSPPQPLYVDFLGMPDAPGHIVALMEYWKSALGNPSLGASRVSELIKFLTPTIDGHPQWGSRVLYDNKVWLQLTPEQSSVVRSVIKNQTSLVTGWPGTGKTLIVIEAARKLALDEKRVLVVSFNTKLTDFIRTQLLDEKSCTVLTWHGLCRQAASALGQDHGADEWYKTTCLEQLKAAIAAGLLGGYDALVVDESQAFLPAWCETLVAWFEHKPKAFFCDETQVFSFERDTVSLKVLSELLGVEPFPLTIILRMPKAVTEILSEVVPPKLQHYSPRDVEHDTAQELITLTPCEDLIKIRASLNSEGVRSEDIIVLTGSIVGRLYYDFLKKSSIPNETIAKFRGLEAPVVLIIGAEQLSTAELFSAYSRSTSKCIAIYNAHNRYWRSREGFQSRLQNRPESSAMLKKEQVNLRIKNLIRGSTGTELQNLKSLNIGWATEWKAWLIEIDCHETQVRLWLDYLCHQLIHPIYLWEKGTMTKFFHVKIDKYDDREACHNAPASLESCDVCQRLTPHTDTSAPVCTLCEAPERKLLPVDPAVIEEMHLLDALITSRLPNDVTLKLQPTLPISIAAAAALMRANKKRVRKNVLLVPLPSGKSFYLAAFTFLQSRIATHARNTPMPINDLADEIYHRFKLLQSITSIAWRSIFSNAVSTFYQKGYLKKAGKGFYLPVEDDIAPIPARPALVGFDIDNDSLDLVSLV
ncbi:nuclease [Pseudomonas syringae KCTC 12500]|uniref:nuclease-related domain-containing DEAD/DEAH box helicase n=1 Tax=Pseudomonas syringae TaxID=317 RepID=UPI00041027F1|nr:NERD domain-containing protein [Pseudomonas syringae]KMY03615.1 nuclease [Pseudomonas syringae KCTC 12500]KPY71181.1 NERD domain-containing protein [Pseudomonas syringae pv. syringae]POR85136.1 nuclease [Pseudomonas syringae pv. syringae]